jgi:hypothetical protein
MESALADVSYVGCSEVALRRFFFRCDEGINAADALFAAAMFEERGRALRGWGWCAGNAGDCSGGWWDRITSAAVLIATSQAGVPCGGRNRLKVA